MDLTDLLARMNLGEVAYIRNDDGSTELDPDYYLRLINSSVVMAEEQLKASIEGVDRRRRAAYEANNWVEYAKLVTEIQEQRMNKSVEIQEKISEKLGLSPDDFLKASNALDQAERGLELFNAQQGQLLDIQQDGDDANVTLTED